MSSLAAVDTAAGQPPERSTGVAHDDSAQTDIARRDPAPKGGAASDPVGNDPFRIGEPGGGGPGSNGARTRGRAQGPLTGIRTQLPNEWRVVLGVCGIVFVVGAWLLAGKATASGSFRVPSPIASWRALVDMWQAGTLADDLLASSRRVAIGYGISVLLGAILGIAIGSFAAVEAFAEPQLGFLRYIPASALTPLFMLWLGIGESPKVWLIVVGTLFYNVLMVADVARAVPRELLNASATLGAGRLVTLRRVILPHSVPGIIDVARINLAAAWLMLVVAELLAAQEGLAYRIVRAQRFRAVDTMFALLILFGLIGLVSDVALRWLRNRTSPWARS